DPASGGSGGRGRGRGPGSRRRGKGSGAAPPGHHVPEPSGASGRPADRGENRAGRVEDRTTGPGLEGEERKWRVPAEPPEGTPPRCPPAPGHPPRRSGPPSP